MAGGDSRNFRAGEAGTVPDSFQQTADIGWVALEKGNRVKVTYTTSSKDVISKVEYYKGTTLVATITNTSGSTTDDYERTS